MFYRTTCVYVQLRRTTENYRAGGAPAQRAVLVCTSLHRIHPAESVTPCLQTSPSDLKLPLELWQSGGALSHDTDSMTACPHVKERMNLLTHAVAFYGKRESSYILCACNACIHTQ